ncbi:hypothetical protein AB6805_30385 [Chitinophaga sp. RCC_12]|uniref:hypothetical protein n=1 Tax=Chitinophaga sp. RCC_12 TaxID=3239226 RepID=UPI0035267497
MEKMRYEDRVKAIAKEMSMDMFFKNEYGKWPYVNTHYASLGTRDKTNREEKLLPGSRIAVAKMAEAATEFLGSLSEHGIKMRLFEYGLIPDKPE